MAKKNDGYLSAKESRRISRENRKITNRLEKQHKRKNVPESEYLTTMKDAQQASADWIDAFGTSDTPEAAALRERIGELFTRTEGTMN